MYSPLTTKSVSMWLHQMSNSLRELGMMMSDKSQTLMRDDPSQMELKVLNTDQDSAYRHLGNEDDRSNITVSIYMHYINVWHKRVRRILDFALQDFLMKELKRSRSWEPPNRVEKMTLKNLYRDKHLQKTNRMHASLNNNLTLQVKNEINEYVQEVEAKGYIVRRIPSVELMPHDKEYEIQLANRRKKAMK